MSTIELTSKVHNLKELKAMAEELAAEISSIEDEIKAEMNARNVEELNVDVFKIRYTTVSNTRLDSKALKAAAPAIWEQFAKQTVSRRFTVV